MQLLASNEVEYHGAHATQWILRLGLGTEESLRRITEGLMYMWPYLDAIEGVGKPRRAGARVRRSRSARRRPRSAG